MSCDDDDCDVVVIICLLLMLLINFAFLCILMFLFGMNPKFLQILFRILEFKFRWYTCESFFMRLEKSLNFSGFVAGLMLLVVRCCWTRR